MHCNIGIRLEEYEKVSKSFIKTLYKTVEGFGAREEQAWVKVFTLVNATMMLQYENKQEPKAKIDKGLSEN